MEQTKAEGLVWHKNCFRCVQCSKQLNVDNYESHESTLYCKPHFKELFQPKPVEESEQPGKSIARFRGRYAHAGIPLEIASALLIRESLRGLWHRRANDASILGTRMRDFTGTMFLKPSRDSGKWKNRGDSGDLNAGGGKISLRGEFNLLTREGEFIHSIIHSWEIPPLWAGDIYLLRIDSEVSFDVRFRYCFMNVW